MPTHIRGLHHRPSLFQRAISGVVLTSLLLLLPNLATAETSFPTSENSSTASSRFQLAPGILVAQVDDSYDPFADYSEFEESVEEEEDLNFFRNGRLLTVGFIGGARGWTQTLSQIYSTNMAFGLFLCYFFDLRFALQFGFLTSDHLLSVAGSGFTPIRGNVNATDIGANLKYYFNTQNVTRGLADLNPYILGGFSQLYRTITVSGNDNFAKDAAFAFNVGAGIEVPMMRNKLFFGLQGMFQYAMFTDEAKIILDENDQSTGISPVGDSFTVLGVLGVNF